MSVKPVSKQADKSKDDDDVVAEVPNPSAMEERVRVAIESARRSADEARHALEVLETTAGEKFGETGEQVTRMIREKPLQAAGMAFVAGVFATLILGRKR